MVVLDGMEYPVVLDGINGCTRREINEQIKSDTRIYKVDNRVDGSRSQGGSNK